MIAKKITDKTTLKQGDKIYSPVMIEGTIYWIMEDLVVHDVRPYYGKYHLEKKTTINCFPDYFTDLSECKLIVAQSKPTLKGVLVVDLDNYIWSLFKLVDGTCDKGEYEHFLFESGFKSNPALYTKEDIEKSILLTRMDYMTEETPVKSSAEIIDRINCISLIEINKDWEIISYI